jgi:hypothetical protein
MNADPVMLSLISREKPKHEPTVPESAADVTGQHIVNSVMYGRGEWRTIDRVLAEAANERRARKIREKYEMTPIPIPEWEDGDL